MSRYVGGAVDRLMGFVIVSKAAISGPRERVEGGASRSRETPVL